MRELKEGLVGRSLRGQQITDAVGNMSESGALDDAGEIARQFHEHFEKMAVGKSGFCASARLTLRTVS